MQDRKPVLVLGATGNVGLPLVQHLLKSNCVVTLLLRQPGKWPLNSAFVKLIQGDAGILEDLKQALQGQQAVYSALAYPIEQETSLFQTWASNIVQASQELGVRRVVFVYGFGLMKINENTLLNKSEHYPAIYVKLSDDQEKSLDSIIGKDLDYTIVCLPKVEKGDFDGKYTVQIEKVENPKWQISTGNAAEFIARVGNENLYLKQKVAVFNNGE